MEPAAGVDVAAVVADVAVADPRTSSVRSPKPPAAAPRERASATREPRPEARRERDRIASAPGLRSACRIHADHSSRRIDLQVSQPELSQPRRRESIARDAADASRGRTDSRDAATAATPQEVERGNLRRRCSSRSGLRSRRERQVKLRREPAEPESLSGAAPVAKSERPRSQRRRWGWRRNGRPRSRDSGSSSPSTQVSTFRLTTPPVAGADDTEARVQPDAVEPERQLARRGAAQRESRPTRADEQRHRTAQSQAEAEPKPEHEVDTRRRQASISPRPSSRPLRRRARGPHSGARGPRRRGDRSTIPCPTT